MKILFLLIFFSHSIFATEAKTIKMQSKVKQVRMLKTNQFQVELLDYAAKYFADEKISQCLFLAIEKKKAVELKTTAYKHQIIECRIKD